MAMTFADLSSLLKGGPQVHRLRRREAPLTKLERSARWLSKRSMERGAPLPPFITAARRYLDLFVGEPPGDDRLQQLAQALDALALAFHDIPDSEADDQEHEPEATSAKDYAKAAAERFPELAEYYAVVDPLDPIGEASMAGDPIDDLGDIAGDVAAGVWLWEHVSPEEGAWYLRLMQFHWGRHLLDLRSLLHARLYETPNEEAPEHRPEALSS